MDSANARKNQCYVVLRDVAKAFDKVWHAGLKYKLSQINLPDTLNKFLSGFLTNRQAKIKVGEFIGPPFPLSAGVPQGSSISPTLYTIYTNDLPESVHGCLNLQYADDITQIITYPGTSRNFMAARTISKIEKINNYEKNLENKNKQK